MTEPPGEAFGCHGGHIASDAGMVDDIRSCAPGFTFTPALPPMIAAAALASIWHVRADAARRSALFERAETLKRRLCAAGMPVLPSMSHIVPLPPLPEPDAFAELGGCWDWGRTSRRTNTGSGRA